MRLLSHESGVANPPHLIPRSRHVEHCGRRRSHVRAADTQVWQSVRAKASEFVPLLFVIVTVFGVSRQVGGEDWYYAGRVVLLSARVRCRDTVVCTVQTSYRDRRNTVYLSRRDGSMRTETFYGALLDRVPVVTYLQENRCPKSGDSCQLPIRRAAGLSTRPPQWQPLDAAKASKSYGVLRAFQLRHRPKILQGKTRNR